MRGLLFSEGEYDIAKPTMKGKRVISPLLGYTNRRRPGRKANLLAEVSRLSLIFPFVLSFGCSSPMFWMGNRKTSIDCEGRDGPNM